MSRSARSRLCLRGVSTGECIGEPIVNVHFLAKYCDGDFLLVYVRRKTTGMSSLQFSFPPESYSAVYTSDGAAPNANVSMVTAIRCG